MCLILFFPQLIQISASNQFIFILQHSFLKKCHQRALAPDLVKIFVRIPRISLARLTLSPDLSGREGLDYSNGM